MSPGSPPVGRPPSCDCGECAKCKHREYMRGWYAKHPGYAARSQKKRRLRDPDALREQDRRKMARRRRVGTPEQKQKDQARTIAGRAIRSGKIDRGPCEVCGTTEQVHAHHDDYAKPLEVRWLCRPHHDELHMADVA